MNKSVGEHIRKRLDSKKNHYIVDSHEMKNILFLYQIVRHTKNEHMYDIFNFFICVQRHAQWSSGFIESKNR